MEDAATASARELGEAVFSNDELSDLPLDIDTEFCKTTAADAKLSPASLTVVCALFDSNGNYLNRQQKVVELRLKDENVAHRRSLGLTLNGNCDLKRGAHMRAGRWPQYCCSSLSP